SQILFRVLDERDKITRLTGMFQKEVARRIAASPGNKDYGILSVLTQLYYRAEYLFDVSPGCFKPPPKVMSGVIRLERLNTPLPCDEELLRTLVKAAFQQRRKTLRNSLRNWLAGGAPAQDPMLGLRPEQLSPQDFVQLTILLAASR
ncbi:MAG: 16S rRNA (adenine(1518)-N(6)/adenine(1519)-N(6))-dimethyltransferase, partial [Chitinophagales bacterium]|nr:16S rRNA (adenine(1518)-N(6)/adenine(1519)-N(6))-dimethyltransferase [Chitinophagales bacterium]MDW8419772.1 rRNA adenine dimethyltransferase family protein [Chitinophagales bacterium]